MDVEARSLEIELVRHPGGQEIAAVAGQGRHAAGAAEALPALPAGHQVAQQVGADAGPGIDADVAELAQGTAPGVLQRPPGAFEEDPVLGVHELGFAGRDAEELGVEELDVVEGGAASHIARGMVLLGLYPRGFELLVAPGGDALDAALQVAPEGVQASAPGKRTSRRRTQRHDRPPEGGGPVVL